MVVTRLGYIVFVNYTKQEISHNLMECFKCIIEQRTNLLQSFRLLYFLLVYFPFKQCLGKKWKSNTRNIMHCVHTRGSGISQDVQQERCSEKPRPVTPVHKKATNLSYFFTNWYKAIKKGVMIYTCSYNI